MRGSAARSARMAAVVTGLVLVGSQDQNESAAILKIKESMQEEAKRFEKDSDHPDFYMQ